jgi:hypothetical protein
MLRRVLVPFFLVGVLVARLSAEGREAHFGISGITINAITGQPLSGCEVSIGKAEDFETTLQKVLSESDGRFAFTRLPPGKYWLAARRNGFRKQAYEEHGGYSSAVAVGPELVSDSLIFPLHPDASISGTIVDEDNEAVPNARVLLFQTDLSTGLKQFSYLSDEHSDDRGSYRFAHLGSGQYFVVVSAQPWYGSVVSQLRQWPAASAPSVFDLIYPTTYYPRATESSSASPIRLHDGESFVADVTLLAEPALRLRVDHVSSDAPRFASLKQLVFGTPIDPPSTQENDIDDGVEIGGIAPGKYVLEYPIFPTSITRSRVVDLSGDTEIDANGMSPQPSIRGIIQRDGGLDLRLPFLRLWNPSAERVLETQYSADGAFSLTTEFLTPGTYFVFAGGENSIITTMVATGAKVIGQSIQISGSTNVQLGIRLSRSLSTINGTALRDGKPISGAMILLVPQNPELNLPLFRRDQSDSDGTFTLRDVLPGRYTILGIGNGWDLEWANPAFLRPRLAHAVNAEEEIRPNMTYKVIVNVE